MAKQNSEHREAPAPHGAPAGDGNLPLAPDAEKPQKPKTQTTKRAKAPKPPVVPRRATQIPAETLEQARKEGAEIHRLLEQGIKSFENIEARLRRLEQGAISQAKTPLIFSAVRNAMKDIVPLAKTHEHPDQGFFFRRIDEVLSQLQPILVAHGIFYLPFKVTKDVEVERPVVTPTGTWVQIYTKVTVQWRLYSAIDGSYLECESMGEGMSEQQFSTAAAQTMAEKTMLCDIFSIPVFGAEDPEEMVGERTQSSQPKQYFTAPEATGLPTPSAPVSGNLFEDSIAPPDAEGEKKKRRSRKDEEPQVTTAGGAQLPEESANGKQTIAEAPKDAPLSQGFVNILKINLNAKKITEAALFAHLGISGFAEMTKGHMGQAEAFIKKGAQP